MKFIPTLSSLEGWFSDKPPYSKSQILPDLITMCAAAACLDYIFMNDEDTEEALDKKFDEEELTQIYENVYGSATYFCVKSSVKSDMKYIKSTAHGKIVTELRKYKEWSKCMEAGKSNADGFIEIVQGYYPDWK